jgi:hypothetical protein
LIIDTEAQKQILNCIAKAEKTTSGELRVHLEANCKKAPVDRAIEVFDGLIAKVNDKKADNRSAHLKAVKNDLETKATELVTALNKLSA